MQSHDYPWHQHHVEVRVANQPGRLPSSLYRPARHWSLLHSLVLCLRGNSPSSTFMLIVNSPIQYLGHIQQVHQRVLQRTSHRSSSLSFHGVRNSVSPALGWNLCLSFILWSSVWSSPSQYAFQMFVNVTFGNKVRNIFISFSFSLLNLTVLHRN